jgi:hypothetical protein
MQRVLDLGALDSVNGVSDRFVRIPLQPFVVLRNYGQSPRDRRRSQTSGDRPSSVGFEIAYVLGDGGGFDLIDLDAFLFEKNVESLKILTVGAPCFGASCLRP